MDGIHYKIPPSKPVVSQIKDVFNGIKYYRQKSKFNIFEIYPFMGINPKHYDEPSVQRMLDEYFISFNKNDSSSIRRIRV